MEENKKGRMRRKRIGRRERGRKSTIFISFVHMYVPV